MRGTVAPGLDAMMGDADAPSEGAPVVVSDTQAPAPAPEPAPQGPARDEQGRFAAQEQHVVETAAPAQPDTPAVPQIDWEKRYNDLRSFSDRRFNEATQRLQTYEERLAEIEAQRHQPAPQVDDYDEYEVDPLQDPRLQRELERLNRIEAQLQQQAQAQAAAEEQARTSAYIDGEMDRLEAAYGVQLPDRIANAIGKDAYDNPDPVTGQPDVEGAFAAWANELNAHLEAQKKAWVDTKRSAPPAPVAGPGAVEVPDLTDRKSRIAYINERIAQHSQ